MLTGFFGMRHLDHKRLNEARATQIDIELIKRGEWIIYQSRAHLDNEHSCEVIVTNRGTFYIIDYSHQSNGVMINIDPVELDTAMCSVHQKYHGIGRIPIVKSGDISVIKLSLNLSNYLISMFSKFTENEPNGSPRSAFELVEWMYYLHSIQNMQLKQNLFII
jgi:hypothetical protein